MCDWAEAQECRILAEGVPLDETQTADAARVGVVHPERVRLLQVSGMPSPENKAFIEAVGRARLVPPDTEALTVGHGIYVNSGYWGIRSLVVHELVHVSQSEKLGGVRGFYARYLAECFSHGYPNGPMEQEAMKVEAAFFDDES
ncbi:MAG: hypothetical protein NT045_05705 [Candidatus Aureabacteria bacterium]|nr:hypothetical protein [Candidatus Auribacterota bacterium]